MTPFYVIARDFREAKAFARNRKGKDQKLIYLDIPNKLRGLKLNTTHRIYICGDGSQIRQYEELRDLAFTTGAMVERVS